MHNPLDPETHALFTPWQPGQPLPVEYYSPCAAGLAGIPAFLTPEQWVDALSAATIDLGLDNVLWNLRTADAAVLRRDVEDLTPGLYEAVATLFGQWMRDTEEAPAAAVHSFWQTYWESSKLLHGVSGDREFEQARSERFVRQHVVALAALAWGAYVKYGRCAVVVDMRRAALADMDDDAIPPLYVVTQAEAETYHMNWPTPTAERLVRHYDPKRSGVALVFSQLSGDLNVTALRFDPEIKPEQCYERGRDAVDTYLDRARAETLEFINAMAEEA